MPTHTHPQRPMAITTPLGKEVLLMTGPMATGGIAAPRLQHLSGA